MHIYIYLYMYVCMYVCTYISTITYTCMVLISIDRFMTQAQRVYTFVGSHTHCTYTFVGFLSNSPFAYIHGTPFARFFPTHEWYLFQLIDV